MLLRNLRTIIPQKKVTVNILRRLSFYLDKYEPIPLGGRRHSDFGQEQNKEEEIPTSKLRDPSYFHFAEKRCRVICFICGKAGHSSDDCFRNPKNQYNRDIISKFQLYLFDVIFIKTSFFRML